MNPLALNPLKIATHAAAFAIGIALAWWVGAMIYDARVAKLKSQREVAVSQAKATLIAEFNQQKASTDALNLENQSRIADLDARLAAVKRVRPNTCTPIFVRPAAASSRDPSQTSGGIPRHDGYGVESDFLYDFAATADKVVVDQNTCVDFLNQIYKDNRQ